MQDSQFRTSFPTIWLRRLRLFAFFGQGLLLLLAVLLYEISLPLLPLIAILSCIPISQFLIDHLERCKLLQANHIGILLSFDTLLLTSLLYFSGGPTNPMSLSYLVLVVLSAFLISKTWTWVIAIVSSLAFASLFITHSPTRLIEHAAHLGEHSASHSDHLLGMLLSYFLVSMFVAYFLSKIIDEVMQERAALENSRINQERLAAMTAVTASAAHELGTPLASLELISSELRLSLKNSSYCESEVISDLELISAEVQRCKTIIQKMCSSSGNITGEGISWINPSELLESVISSMASSYPIKVLNVDLKEEVLIQETPLSTALGVILQNSIDASNDAGVSTPIEVYWDLSGSSLSFTIRDFGVGIPKEIFPDLGKPFVSSKKSNSNLKEGLPEGQPKGMGLGVYIANLIAGQLGGSLEFTSEENIQQQNNGTIATLNINVLGIRSKSLSKKGARTE